MESLTDAEISAVTKLFSDERLATFREMSATPRDAIALHQQMLRLAGTLMSVTAVIEIALRNAICDRLSEHFGGEGWLRCPPAPFVWKDEERGKIEAAVRGAQRAAYIKLDAADKRALDEVAFRRGVPPDLEHELRTGARQRSIVVRGGQVITQLTLYFWKRLFSRDYEQTLWKPALKRIFPSKAIDRSTVAVQLEQIHQTRNRVAHHEPVYGPRLFDTLTAVDFLASNLGTVDSDGCSALRKILHPDCAALESQAHALYFDGVAADEAAATCAKRGRLASRASGNSHGDRRRTHADAADVAHLKPRLPDRQRS